MPARKMIRFVPNTDQTNVIITATNAECSWPSRFGCQKPRPVWSSRLRKMPCLSGSKKRRATKAITTHETAVGRKKTERKHRQPRTCMLGRKATPHGRDVGSGHAASGLRRERRRTFGRFAVASWTLIDSRRALASRWGGKGCTSSAAGKRPSSVIDGPPLVRRQRVVRLLHALQRSPRRDVAPEGG